MCLISADADAKMLLEKITLYNMNFCVCRHIVDSKQNPQNKFCFNKDHLQSSGPINVTCVVKFT